MCFFQINVTLMLWNIDFALGWIFIQMLCKDGFNL